MQAGPPSTFVVSITPFDGVGALDDAGLAAHLSRMGDAGVGVYLGGSGSGEGYSLSRDEARRVLEIGVATLAGRVPVRAMGVEPRTAAEMTAYAELAADTGVDAVQVYSLDQGHGNRPSRPEMTQYYDDVLGSHGVPVVLSTHQSVGYLIPVELIAELLERYPNIVGVNCSTNELAYLTRLIEAVAGRVDVHVGGPMHALSCLGLGGQGYLSSDANLTPRLCVEVIDAWTAGELARCADAYARVMALFSATRELGGITGTKAALRLAGLPGGFTRRPRLDHGPERDDEIRRRLVDRMGRFDTAGEP